LKIIWRYEMRRIASILLALAVMLPLNARGEVYFAFSAEQLEYQGNQRIFFVPFSFTGPTHRQIERKISVLFEKLHGSRQGVYGDTYLIVKENAGKLSAHLILDPEAARFHDVIIGEIYLTLANIGITEISMGPDEKLLTDTDVKFPYFVPTIPLWEALPPSSFPHALIRLGVDEYIESHTFYARMGRKDSALYTRITDLLKSDQPYVKLRVMESFPQLAVASEASHLIPLLNDVDARVRYKAIELLQEKKEANVLNALATLADSSTDPETQLRAARILVANGNNNYQIYILFEQLKSEEMAVVVQTLQKLAASGDKRVIPALVRSLIHANQEVRAAAFAGLTQIGDLNSLLSLLTNKEIGENFRKAAAVELMKQNVPDFAKKGISYLVKNHAGKEAVEAVTTIEMRKYVDMADILVGAMAHTDEKVALTAVAALGNLDLFDKLADISNAARRKELTKSARNTIAKLLAKQSLRKMMKLAGSDDILIRELAVLALVAVAKTKTKEERDITPILDLLGEAMKDKEAVIKRAAVLALHEIGGKRNWKRLLRIKKDSDPKIRILVGQAALALQSEEGDQVILELLADEDDEVRIAAIGSVRERKIKSARQKLKFMVEARNKTQKTEALKAIVALNETEEEHKEFFDIYKKLIFDMDPEVSLSAIQGIQWIIDPMVVPLLQSGMLIMHKDARIRAATLVALGRSKDYNVVEHIARGFADGQDIVQKAAIEGLRLMGHKKGVTPLKEFVKQTDDEDLKVLAEDAIAEIETKPKGLLD